MWGLLNAVVDFFLIREGIRAEQRSGAWSWRKFAAALGFAVLEGVLLLLPFLLGARLPQRYFLPAYLGALAIALVNFAWFIPMMRHWKRA